MTSVFKRAEDPASSGGPTIEQLQIVQDLFRQAWPRRVPPAIDHCYSMAVRMDILRRKSRRPSPRPELDDCLLKATRKFLRALGQSKLALEARLKSHGLLTPFAIEAMGPDPLLHHMVEAEKHVSAIEAALRGETKNPASFLAIGAQETWRRLGADVPHSPKHDDPLCVFTTSALERCGINYSLNSVSDMLRNRTARHRSGKSKLPPEA
jgi:hypothetical protein